MSTVTVPGSISNTASSPGQTKGTTPSASAPSVVQTSTLSTQMSSVPAPAAPPNNATPNCVPGWNSSLSTQVTCPTGTPSATPTPVVPKPTPNSTPILMPSQPPLGNSTSSGNSTASVGPLPAKKGLSGGAVAGVAIGMLLVGLLIAGAVFFFLLRRQKKKRNNSIHAYPQAHTLDNLGAGMSEKGPTAIASVCATNIDDMLPQPVADDTITDGALKIRDNIKNHVRTYYHASPVPVAGINQASMGELAVATGTSPTMLASMLSNTSTRAETLRLIVAWVVLSRCTGERNESLLPGYLAMIATSIPGRDGNNAAQSAMYSKWKTTTGALLHERFGQNTQDPDRKQRFASAAADLDSIVAPFVQSGLEAQRSKNLDMILTRSANFAFLLFSQPGTFHFNFLCEHGGLVVFPGLVQTIGDQGQVLGPPRVLLEKEISA